MTRQVTTYSWVPPFAQGYVRDLRVRWACEEAGLPYEVIHVNKPEHEAERAWQPFGQVPAYKDDDVLMFESGAIVLHLAAKSEALSPKDPAGHARMMTWVIAALNSIEPFAQNYVQLDTFFKGQDWTEGFRPGAKAILDKRLASLSKWLGDKDYLEDRFTAGDIIMCTVLRELVDTHAFTDFPNLGAYVARCEARPAFGRAMEAQMATFRENAPA